MRTPVQPPALSINRAPPSIEHTKRPASLAGFPFSFNLFYQRHPPAPKIIAQFMFVSAAYPPMKLPASNLQSHPFWFRLVYDFTNNH